VEGAAGRRRWHGALRHARSGADIGARLQTTAVGGTQGKAGRGGGVRTVALSADAFMARARRMAVTWGWRADRWARCGERD
jgi:hypothetical protein